DAIGTRLELCTDAQFCTPPETTPSDEVFWWSAAANITRGGATADLVLAEEGAYANDAVAAGDQITFGRVRVDLEGFRANSTYRITHPYGVMRLTTSDKGRGRFVRDLGCVAPEDGGEVNCNFAAALRSPISKAYLRWDPRVARAPKGFLGNVNIARPVVGSPKGTNYFKIKGPAAGGPGKKTAVTRRFFVEGQLEGTPDRVRPDKPSAPNLLASSDTGIRTDNVTEDRTPTFSGRAEDASTVRLFVDGKRKKRQFADNANYEIRLRLAPGVHRIKATATDLSGNVSRKSAALRIRIAR
ncbi:MAG: Ig-like domain-containing protein, partial [Actinomycetota bacterium]|nr:Ig-like domain-containing protein [Actinomycetota bacterium]